MAKAVVLYTGHGLQIIVVAEIRVGDYTSTGDAQTQALQKIKIQEEIYVVPESWIINDRLYSAGHGIPCIAGAIARGMSPIISVRVINGFGWRPTYGVVEQLYEESMGSNLEGKDFLVDQLGVDNLGGAGTVTPSSYHSDRALLSYLGRVNYVFDERYMATFTYRADASSVFGDDNKWGYFPSGSVAWRVSEEPFLKESGLVTELKLRGSYGLTGNQGISPYQSLARLTNGGRSYPYNGQTATDIGFGIGGLDNPNLKWETTAQSNVGLDLSSKT